MQTDRIASFGGLDQNQVRKFKRHKEKEKAAQTQKDIEEKAELLCSTDESSLSGSNKSSSETEVLENLTDGSSTQKHRKRKAGTGVFAYCDVMKSERLASLALRLQMTPAQQSIYAKKLVEVCRGGSSKPNLSYSYVDKPRRETTEKMLLHAKNNSNPLPSLPLHTGIQNYFLL